eukprot:Skav209494  [mRNA]  locus=scaffold1892:303933:309790:+ [translate_table: standard]
MRQGVRHVTRYGWSRPSLRLAGLIRTASTAAKGGQGPLLVSATGAPLSSSASGSGTGASDLELTPENAAQVLQSGSPFLLLVGELENQVAKKIGGLQKAAQGRLPIVRLDCSKLPQVCQALQIASSPTLLLMAKGQVLSRPDLQNDARIRAIAGLWMPVDPHFHLAVLPGSSFASCLPPSETMLLCSATPSHDPPTLQPGNGVDSLWYTGLEQRRDVSAADQSKILLEELQGAGHAGLPEAGFSSTGACLKPEHSRQVDAFEAGLSLLRRNRSDEANMSDFGQARQLVLSLVEALGPQHPKSASSRRRALSSERSGGPDQSKSPSYEDFRFEL